MISSYGKVREHFSEKTPNLYSDLEQSGFVFYIVITSNVSNTEFTVSFKIKEDLIINYM